MSDDGDDRKTAGNAALKREISNTGKKEKDDLHRIFSAGNAGGAVATLALIGTILGQGQPFPRILLVILLIFVVGLAALTLDRIIRLFGHVVAFGRVERGEKPITDDETNRSAKIGFSLSLLAGGCLLLGLVLGFYQLLQFSGPVAALNNVAS